jgi:four helix bundle protein
MNQFYKLEVWQRARIFCKQIYTITKNYPSSENFGLINQMKRAAVSIPSNIAEGSGRKSKNEFLYFLNVSNGSAFELETQINISKDLEYISDESEENLLKELHIIQNMLYKLIDSMQK